MQLLRNCNVTTVAPTGTISIIAGCSSGLEPLFAVAFMRNQAGVMMPDVNEDFVAIAKREGWYSEALMERIAEEGRVNFPEVPEKWQRVFVTAQRRSRPSGTSACRPPSRTHCDSAISKTTNFAHTRHASTMCARSTSWRTTLKCKGVTVYRDGSRDNQVLSTGATDKATARRGRRAPADEDRARAGRLHGAARREGRRDRAAEEVAVRCRERESAASRQKRARPDKLRSTSIRKDTPLGTMYVHISEDERGQPFEVFISLGKAGGSAMADAEAMGRLISLALRSGIPLMEIHQQLRGISSDRAVGLGPHKVLSVPDAIGIALYEWHQDKQGVQQELLRETRGPSTAAPMREESGTFSATITVGGTGSTAGVGAANLISVYYSLDGTPVTTPVTMTSASQVVAFPENLTTGGHTYLITSVAFELIQSDNNVSQAVSVDAVPSVDGIF